MAALNKKVTKGSEQLEDVQGKLGSANALQKINQTKQKKKLADGISKTNKDIAKFQKDCAERKEKNEEDLQSLQQNHHDQSHKIKGNIAFWERSRNALKEYEQEEAEKSKEDEGGEEGAHQNNVDRLKASLEDLRIETHLPHHDDKDDPMEGLADLYCY